MRKKSLLVAAVPIVFVIAFAAIAVGVASQREAAKFPAANQQRPKKLREIAMERDVEVPGLEENSEYYEYSDVAELAKEARAIVYGRIVERNSYFDDSAHPTEHGTIIMTTYTVEVLRVLKDKTEELKSMLPPDKPAAPLKTPLKITRNGGVVYVNGHRASMKVKGFEEINPGQEYVFFLFWSSAYKSYSLAGNISGVIVVNYDSSLRSLASSEKMKTKVRGMTLESLINQIK